MKAPRSWLLLLSAKAVTGAVLISLCACTAVQVPYLPHGTAAGEGPSPVQLRHPGVQPSFLPDISDLSGLYSEPTTYCPLVPPASVGTGEDSSRLRATERGTAGMVTRGVSGGPLPELRPGNHEMQLKRPVLTIREPQRRPPPLLVLPSLSGRKEI